MEPTSRYLQEQERKETFKQTKKLPANAKKIVTTYKPVARKHDRVIAKHLKNNDIVKLRGVQLDKPKMKKKRTYGQHKWISRYVPARKAVYKAGKDEPSLHDTLGLPKTMDYVEVPVEEYGHVQSRK